MQHPLWGPLAFPACPGWSSLCFSSPAPPSPACDADWPKERLAWRSGEGVAGTVVTTSVPSSPFDPLHTHPSTVSRLYHILLPLGAGTWHLLLFTQPDSSLPLGVSNPSEPLLYPISLGTSPVFTAPAAGSCHPLVQQSILHFRIPLAS